MAEIQKDTSPSKPLGYQPPRTASELVRRYEAGERHFWDVDIPERSDLSGSKLAGAIFDHGWLSDIDFRGADLRGVRFMYCNVKCSDFRGANLENASFPGALVEATYFKDANLNGASFAGACFHGSELSAGDMPDWGD